MAMAVKPLTIERGVPLFVTGSSDEVDAGREQGAGMAFSRRGAAIGVRFSRGLLQRMVRARHRCWCCKHHSTLSMVEPFVSTFKKSGGQILDVVYYNPKPTVLSCRSGKGVCAHA